MTSTKTLRCVLLACVIGLASTIMGHAIPTKYGSPGTTNPTTYSFTAVGNGTVTAYFVGETAGYGSMIGLGINGAKPLSFGLQNHTNSGYGDTLVMGTVVAGDVLRFYLSVDPNDSSGPSDPFLPSYFLNSDASLNPNGENHIFSSAYGGDATIPAGTYVGFEDISPLASGDRDYDDHEFVFTGPGLSRVPDGGASMALFGLALTVLSFVRRKYTK